MYYNITTYFNLYRNLKIQVLHCLNSKKEKKEKKRRKK